MAMVEPKLITACKTGQLEQVRHLLVHGRIPVNETFGILTPLSVAAEHGHVEVMRLLFEHGAKPDFAGTDSYYESWTPLNDAAKSGQYEAAELLLLKGANVSYSSPVGDTTPLKLAAENGHAKLVKLLLDKGAKIHSQQHSIAPSALTLACKNGHAECTKLLLEHDTDINHLGKDIRCEDTPLACAAQKGHTECTELLLQKGADVHKQLNGNTPLLLASEGGHVKVVELLLERDADTSNRANALYRACHHKHMEVAKVLIKNGTNVNHFPEKALQTLLVMISSKYFDIAHLLIQNGIVIDARSLTSAIKSRNPTLMSALLQNAEEHLLVQMNGDLVEAVVDGDHNFAAEVILPHVHDLNVRLKSGNTALMEATKLGKEEHVKLLLKHSAQVDIQDENGCIALVEAAKRDTVELMKRLLDHDSSQVNIQNNDGCTALMEVSKCGKEEHVKLLLDHCAKVNIQDVNGYTALMMASKGGHTKCVEQLLTQKDIDVNLQNIKECTALMLASENGHTSVVEPLLANNANLEIVTTRGCSALFYGVKSNSPAVVKVLLDRGADVERKTLDDKNIIQYAYICHKEEPDRQVIKMLKKALANEHNSPPTKKPRIRGPNHGTPKYTVNDVTSGTDFGQVPIESFTQPGPAQLREKVEVILHTCNDNENNAVLKLLSPPTVDGRKIADKVVYDGAGFAKIGMFGTKLVAVPLTGQGDDARGDLQIALEEYKNVKAIVGSGIGYGNPQKAYISFGDVMVSDVIVKGSKTEKEDEYTFTHTIPAHGPLLKHARNLKSGFNGFIVANNPDRTSTVHIGTIVSTDILVKAATTRDKLMAVNRKAIGGEMEGWVLLGVLDEMRRKGRIIDIIVIKGVSDLGDKDKNDDWQPTAAMAAVNFVHYVLENCGSL